MENVNIASDYASLERLRKELLDRTVNPTMLQPGSVLVIYERAPGRPGPTAPSINTLVGPRESLKDYLAARLQCEGPGHPANNLTRLMEAYSSPDGEIWVIRTHRSNYYGD